MKLVALAIVLLALVVGVAGAALYSKETGSVKVNVVEKDNCDPSPPSWESDEWAPPPAWDC